MVLGFNGIQVYNDIVDTFAPMMRWRVILHGGAIDMMVATKEVDVWLRFGNTAKEVACLGLA
jgi:hypothetical protein